MGSSWELVFAAASLLVLLSSACKDAESCLQREVTISPDFLDQVLQEPDSFMLQREVDLSELLNIDVQRTDGKPGPRGFRPRSFPPVQSYPVQFPLGRPTPDNIQAICVHADHRPRYPDSYFPPSGFSKQKRMATAVNNAESWFSTCCKGNQTWGTEGTLCCATQAWEHSVELFCEEDSSVKDRLYECCRQRGMSRLSCFNNDAQNPNYKPSEEIPVEEISSSQNFHFNLNSCPRIQMSRSNMRALRGERPELNAPTSQKIDINFPPGRPTADNIESLCGNQKRRPLYTTKCLPHSGYELLAHQVKTINRLEKRFKQCCKKKKGALICAEQKWREELNRYCSVRNGGQECCQADDQYSCFQSISSDPLYNTTSAAEEPTLSKMCDTETINNRFPVGFQLKTRCCPLPEQDRNSCFELNLAEISQSLCSSNKSGSPVVRRCCKMTSREEIPQCLSKNVMKAITKATKKGQKKKKICPIP
ncbi:extracellular matrix protein 1 isoform X1 [Xiphophorus hellerii]|uniref:extracellular matrix protein 1 isoform X1 n=1 Tax=Xiphophorus hellerii TaxID=8084 RepID=UPI0013B3BB79|nr:extracellular matrix protein 1 isoform X1 [Xiphophorus hellerii]